MRRKREAAPALPLAQRGVGQLEGPLPLRAVPFELLQRPRQRVRLLRARLRRGERRLLLPPRRAELGREPSLPQERGVVQLVQNLI